MSSLDTFTLEEYTALPEPLMKALGELDSLCFRNNYTQSEADHTDQDEKFCSGGDLLRYILARDHGAVIGEARVYKRVIPMAGKPILLGGIGSVGTHPDKRKTGVATAMMTRAMELLRQTKCDIAYLCCDTYNKKLVLWYQQFGFRLLDKPHTYLGKSGKRHTDIDGMVAPLGNQLLFQAIFSDKTPLDIGVGNW